MYRFTTPDQCFQFNYPPQSFLALIISYAQENRGVILEKHKEDLQYEEPNTAYFTMTQEESAKFKPKLRTTVQATAIFPGGKRFTTDEVEIEIKPVQHNSVMEV